MRLRVLTAAVVAVLACAGLSACRTKVGLAATADGHRITESQVNAYVTRNAQPVQVQDASSGASTQMAPRTYALQTVRRISDVLALRSRLAEALPAQDASLEVPSPARWRAPLPPGEVDTQAP